MSIELGSIVKDEISGFEGMVTAQIVYITGCMQFKVDPVGALWEGKPINGQWFDEARLDPVAMKASVAAANSRVLSTSSTMAEPGGPVGSMPSSQHP